MVDHLPDAQLNPTSELEEVALFEQWFYQQPEHAGYHAFSGAYNIAWRTWKAARPKDIGIDFLFKWMRSPNPMLGNISPEQMIKLGRGHTLIQFIHDAQEDFEAMQPSSGGDTHG